MPWEKGFAAPPLTEWLAAHAISGRVLVPGCGSGHDVRELARAGAEPVGLDIAPSAINLADAQPRVGPERYCLGDLFALPPELSGFDWVFEHTCFCAIAPSMRPAYVEAVQAALKPRGMMLAVFYLDPGHDHPDDGPPFGVTREELDRLFSGRFKLIEEAAPTIAYAGREGRELVRLLRAK